MLHGSHGLTQPFEARIAQLDAHVADLRAEIDALRSVQVRLDRLAEGVGDLAVELAQLAGPAGRVAALAGPWWALLPFSTHRVRLTADLRTAEAGVEPERDLRLRVLADALGGFDGRRVLDLGCLEGGFTVEMARRGAAEVVGVEARPLSVRRCELLRALTGLDAVRFLQADVMHELTRRQDSFDAILATGILYHLGSPDAALRAMRERSTTAVLVCTHVAGEIPTHGCSVEVVEHVGERGTYRGRWYSEGVSGVGDAPVSVGTGQADLWAASGGATSFWPFEDDLLRMFDHAGFGSVERIDPGAYAEPWQVDQLNRVMYLCRP